MRIYSKERNKKISNTIKRRINEGKIHPFKKGNSPWNKNKKGYKFSEKAKINISNGHKGHIVSENTRKKISLSNKGKKRTKEQIEKISKSHIGLKQNEETIKKRIKKGKEHYNWKGGISLEPYTTDWTNTLKRAIRERDKYICQICNKYGWCIHHIDYNKKNCNSDNLITLCKSCHAKTNFNRNYWKNVFK